MGLVVDKFRNWPIAVIAGVEVYLCLSSGQKNVRPVR